MGDIRLFVDVDGLEWVPDGDTMRRRPTALVLHGGPGLDSAVTKPSFGFLREIAQVVYVDHRGNGRSDRSDPTTWTLAQWGDDVRSLCEALGIERPIVIGVSFGGMVAMSYATRHPEHPGALVLAVTEAREPPVDMVVDAFRRLGGEEVADIVRRDLIHSTEETSQLFVERALPLMSQSPDARTKVARVVGRAIRRQDVELHFNNGEGASFDFRGALGTIRCPTLVLGGAMDPVVPPEAFAEIRDALPDHLVEAHLIEGAGHLLALDATERFQQLIAGFTSKHALK